jgi:hypothetical protein
MNPDGPYHPVSDITLEQYFLGELTKSERAEVERRMEEDETIQARLNDLKKSSQAILEQHPPEIMSRQIQTMLDRPRTPSVLLRPWPAAALLGAAATLILFVLVLPHDLITSRDSATEQIKGQGPYLTLFRKTRDGSEALGNGARVYPGDILRIGYQAVGRHHGAIVSVDGRGSVTLHHPDDGDRSARLESDGQVLLDFALELDDAPRWERFYFITSNEPFELAPVLQSARRIDTERPIDRPEELDLPRDLEQYVVSFEKGIRR